ncbi:MAG: hypothetical protein ABFC98_07790, partial [Candidatus Cloacimonas sp.]
YGGNVKLIPADKLNTWHSILMVADKVEYPGHSLLTVEEARLLGWLITDGYWRFRGNSCEAVVYQSPKKYLDIVKEVAGGKPRKPHPDSGVICVPVLKERLKNLIPYLKNNNFSFIPAKLSKESLEALYEAMYLADGTMIKRRGNRDSDFLACTKKEVLDTFVISAFLLGKRTREGKRGTYISNRRTLKVSGALGREHYKGFVWCPLTENKTWVMRQNGIVTITGNTWIRKNSVRQFELLAKQTGKYATLSKTLNFANQASGLTAEEKANMPEYFRTDAYTKTPLKTAEGLPLFFNPNFGFQDLARIFSPQDMASAITPFAKIPIELFANKEIFSNYPIKSESFGKQYPIDWGKEAPAYLQFMNKFDNKLLNQIGLTKDEKGTLKMSDMFAYALKQVPAFYTAQRMFPNTKQPKTPYDWLSIMLGIKLTPLDVNKEKTNRLHEMENDLNSAIDEYNRLNPSNAIPTNSDIEKAYKTLALNYIYEKYGMKQTEELQNIMDTTGGNQNLNLMLTLAKQPYNEEKKQISGMDMEAIIKYLQSVGINPSKQEIKDIIKSQQ